MLLASSGISEWITSSTMYFDVMIALYNHVHQFNVLVYDIAIRLVVFRNDKNYVPRFRIHTALPTTDDVKQTREYKEEPYYIAR